MSIENTFCPDAKINNIDSIPSKFVKIVDSSKNHREKTKSIWALDNYLAQLENTENDCSNEIETLKNEISFWEGGNLSFHEDQNLGYDKLKERAEKIQNWNDHIQIHIDPELYIDKPKHQYR